MFLITSEIINSDVISNVVPDDVAQEVEQKINIFQKFMNDFPQKALSFGIRIVLAIIFFVIGSWVIKLLRKILKKSLKKANADTGVIQFLDSLVKVILYLILIFMIASSFGLDATGAVAVLGSAGVALGLALQGSLSNFAGGVLILLLKPFRVGDYIKEDNKGNEGTVLEIQLFYTKLLTFDEKVVILPNGTLANTSLTNVTATPDRRLDMSVDISYDSDLKKAKELALELLKNDPAMIATKECTVFVNALKDSAIELNARMYVANSEYFAARSRFLEQVKTIFDENGISIPYNQVDVHFKNEKEFKH